jgi:hypothetical protein
MNYVTNAFSLQMLKKLPARVKVEEAVSLPFDFTSAVGHADLAAVLGVPMNRINVTLTEGDTLYVAQVIGGRLPEGTTTLPSGFQIKLMRVTLES